MRWLFRAKNTIKIRSKKSHVDHGGKWHIAAYWCSFTTKLKKTKTTVEFSAFTKIWKTKYKRSNYVYKKKGTCIMFRIFHHHLLHKSLTNFCITWDHLLYHTILLSYQWTKINTRKIPDTVFIKSTHFKWTINPVLNSSYF